MTTVWLLAAIALVLIAILAAAISVRKEEKRREAEKAKGLLENEHARHVEAERREKEEQTKQAWLQGEKDTWLREERIRQEERKRTRQEDALPLSLSIRMAPHGRSDKHVLYGRQEGVCAGCFVPFPFRNMTVDHIVPRARSGPDHIDNLQLLCGACNSLKGTGTQEELMAKLKAAGI